MGSFEIENQRSTAYLYVQAPEAPKFAVSWYKEGVQLEEGFKYHLLEDEDQSTLVVVEADACDQGEYTCVAVNEVGTFSSKATLQVAGKESSLTEPASPEVMPLVIAEPLKDFITREGQSARFTCKITG